LKIRVLEVLATLKRAGAERIAVSLATRLDPARFECEVVSLFPPFDGGFEPVLAARGVPVQHLGKHPGLDPRIWPRLTGAIRGARPDIIHTHSYILRYALPAWWCARQGIIVHTVHNLARFEVGPFGRAVHRLAFRSGVRPVGISEAVSRSFERTYGFPPAVTIPNGAETIAGFRPEARLRWRAANGFSDSDLLLVSLARLEPQKNPAGLIEAFAAAFPTASKVHLIMAGEGGLRPLCLATARRLGVEARVHLPGVCQEVAELLSACDIFVLASRWEGASLSILEAMAARLPVVATAVGGVPELVEPDRTGILLPPGDPAAIAAALAGLAADPARCRAMGEAAAQRAREFDTSSMVKGYAAFFERVHGGLA
jgi:glycosyltransferase involved in cell wall biosynthesis